VLRVVNSRGRIDDVIACAHEEGICDSRKPRPELVLKAARKWDIDLKGSILLGDSACDRDLPISCDLRFVPVTKDV
jgi:histidinol phosphatase-like enzyme